MKRSFLITLPILALFAPACKKENNAPPFSPAGYWTGNIFVYESVIVNRENHTTSLYLQVPNGDTASATDSWYGTYTGNENTFHALYTRGTDTLSLETTQVSQDLISGYVRINSAPGTRLPFEFTK